MRRPLVTAVLALCTALAVSSPVSPSASSSASDTRPAPSVAARQLAAERADRTLARAHAVLADGAGADPRHRVDGTLAVRDLFLALPDLDDSGRKRASSMLARPTDGSADAYGDGYTVASEQTCAGHFCLHWVNSTSDAPPSRAWVDRTLDTMNRVWRHHIDQMGYRRPVRDGSRGGNDLFDVYLEELGSKGLYGYCAPERRKEGAKWLASGYCVLDNDFAESQYHAKPFDTLRVTAAHEFFHAIQFAYDYGEDQWFMEATATWMEERFADDVNDNRQYLPYGQIGHPERSLDYFNSYGFNQYGNWPFFEYLSSRFGNAVVRKVWNQAAANPGAPDLYSTRALRAVLGGLGGFRSIFRGYTAANTVPGRTYAEGGSWPEPRIDQRWRLTRSDRDQERSFSIDHLASRSTVVTPGRSLTGTRWRGRVTIDAPDHGTSPTAYLIIRWAGGHLVKKSVPLSRTGAGRAEFAFGHGQVRSVTVTLGNASTRFACWQQMDYSCQGRSRDQDRRFRLQVAAFRR